MKGHGDFSIGSDVWPGTSKLLEEMGELQQVLGKLIACAGAEHHFSGANLREDMHDETGDVVAAIEFFIEKNGLNTERIRNRARAKLRVFHAWHDEQQAHRAHQEQQVAAPAAEATPS